jgi:hypothetical protein
MIDNHIDIYMQDTALCLPYSINIDNPAAFNGAFRVEP